MLSWTASTVVNVLPGTLFEELTSFLTSGFITLSNTDIENCEKYAIRRISAKLFSKLSLKLI